MSLALIDAFLEMMMVERGSAPNTLQAYGRDLRQFHQSSPNVDLCARTTQHLRHFLAQLSNANLSPPTRARKLSTLKQFYAFLFAEGYINTNPCQIIEGPKMGRRLPNVLTEDQVALIMETAYADESPEGRRLQAFLEILYSCGLRITELITLPHGGVLQSLASGLLMIHGKGGKQRLVPMGKQACDALEAYMEVRNHFGGPSVWLFPSRGKQGHLTRQRFDQLLRELSVKAGFERTFLSAHSLRHAFATHLLHNGADLIAVQRMLGHATLSTTEIYTHVLPDHLKDMVETYHPLSSHYKASSSDH